MNRSYSKIRHIQESNQRLENRLLNEQYNDEDELKSRMDSYRNKNEDDELRTRLESYKNKMDGFLDELKSSGSEIDVARFLKQVRNQTDQIYRELDEKSEKALTSFARLQFDLLKHFRHKLKEQ
jgi:hypothetical protein